MKSKFRFSAVIEFEIEEQEAAIVLSENDGQTSVGRWLHEHCPVLEECCSYNANALRTAFGSFLAAKRVEECRQLTMSCHDSVAAVSETTTQN